MNYDNTIKEHYDAVAKSEGAAETSTMADLYIRKKETTFILDSIEKFIASKKTALNNSQLDDKIKILDVGCGNGFTLSKIRERFDNSIIEGIESNDSLRAIAGGRFPDNRVKIRAGDIREQNSLPEIEVDVLICQRVIINLLNTADQKRALRNLIKLVKINGLLVFIESFQNEFDNLNSARREFGLEPIAPAHHNLYLSSDFFDVCQLKKICYSDENLLSTHFFVSRVLHASFLSERGLPFFRNSHYVNFFSRALPESIGDYSPLKFLSFEREM